MESLKTKPRRIVVVPKKNDKKFKVKSSDTHPSLPKVPKKKKKNPRMYFDEDVQNAIIRYNQSDDDAERNKIYQEEIHYAFDKLCENIINTFKFEYFDDVYIDVKQEVLSFLVMNMHKYDHTKGSKAFSYFSVVCKNYLILHNNNNYKKYKTHDDILTLDTHRNFTNDTNERKEYLEEFIDELVKYFDNNILNIFKNKKDIDVAYAIIELFKKRAVIENFNKKSLYILIREMTDVNTSHITRVTNVFKKQYGKLLSKFDRDGTLKENINKFF